jgi:uncharacterized membrane protein YfcA
LLIYLVGEEEKVAIAESLGIVGAIAFAGFIPYAFKKQVHWKSVILFGLPGMAGSFIGAYTSSYVSATVQLLIFSGVMLLAAVMMFRDSTPKDQISEGSNLAWWIIALEGLAVGILTGLVGVGRRLFDCARPGAAGRTLYALGCGHKSSHYCHAKHHGLYKIS